MDRKALMNRDLENYDALYLEGRSNTIRIKEYTIPYMLFLIGYFSLEVLYIAVDRIFEHLFPFWDYDIKEDAQEKGLDVEDETDLEIHEMYAAFDDKVKLVSLGLFVGLFIATFAASFRIETIDLIWWTTSIPYWVIPVILGVLLPFAYSGFVVIYGGDGSRDGTMAESVDSIADEKGHDGVLILVGDEHVEPVTEELEELGWNVEPERSSHPLSKFKRLIFR